MNLIQQTPQSLLDKWCRSNANRKTPVSLEVFLKERRASALFYRSLRPHKSVSALWE
tara:strand:- start:184 stop:354 length:171 start_codon:yes stop_codon:yes gene_type:complete